MDTFRPVESDFREVFMTIKQSPSTLFTIEGTGIPDSAILPLRSLPDISTMKNLAGPDAPKKTGICLLTQTLTIRLCGSLTLPKAGNGI